MPQPGAVLAQKTSKKKKGWKRAITTTIIGWFYPKSNYLRRIIYEYMCIKYESNTLIFLKDIERKPFFEVEKGSLLS